MKFEGKVALVTGASSGIGLTTAKLLSRLGSKIALVARSKEKLEEISQTLPGSLPIPTDMSKSFEIKPMIEKARDHFGRIDILINSAGQGYDALVEKTDIDTLRYIFELDLIGPLLAMQEVIPIMRGQGGGSIVNISSGTALMILPNNGGYSALKRALAALSLTAREELARDGIKVSVMYPYMTRTAFEESTIKGPLLEEEGGGEDLRPLDEPEYAARKLVEGIESGEAEIFAHDWMKKLRI